MILLLRVHALAGFVLGSARIPKGLPECRVARSCGNKRFMNARPVDVGAPQRLAPWDASARARKPEIGKRDKRACCQARLASRKRMPQQPFRQVAQVLQRRMPRG
jgi:hypothetical protein